ncbi:MAG: hypothetical protein WCT27_05475, partial [Patescibacteria group bacterium]
MSETTSTTNTAEASSQNVSHEVTLFAEPVFDIGKFTVTNALINTWAVVLIIIIASLAIRKKIA